jgi:rhodanese-related sulfurtransferase
MSPKVLTPQEVQTWFAANPTGVYVDVRTVAEFAAGHPRGKVVNIPVVFYHPTTHEIFANQSFLLVIEAFYPEETPIIVGCDTGERARQAAQQLLAAGYTDVAVMPDGFTAWRQLKLPTTTDNRDGISYVSLLTKVKQKGKKKAAH